MERGVYAQGWFARGYNYHPSLPPRRLKMAEDFAAYRATIMTWPVARWRSHLPGRTSRTRPTRRCRHATASTAS